MIKLIPLDGVDYQTEQEVIDAWNNNDYFIISDLSSRYTIVTIRRTSLEAWYPEQPIIIKYNGGKASYETTNYHENS